MESIQNYRAMAFFDLDGTLLNAKSQLDPEVIEALAHIKKNGTLPFIATGRGYFELSSLMNQAGITGAISLNGAYNMLDDKLIYHEAIPTAVISKLLAEAKKCGETLAFYDGKRYLISEMTEMVRKTYDYTHAPLPKVNPTFYLTHDIDMLLVFTDQNSQVAHYAALVPELNFFRNSKYSIDVVNNTVNKGTGVKHILEVLDFHGETYGFGDGPNDLALLEAVNHKTAMGNAVPELKKLADFVTTDNIDHGIVNALKHWELL